MAKAILRKLAGQKWYIEHFDGMPLFVEMSGSRISVPEYGCKIPKNSLNICYFRHGQGDWLSLISEQEAIGRKMVEVYERTSDCLNSYEKRWTTRLNELEKFYYREFKKDLAKISDQELIRFIESIQREFRNVSIPGFIDGYILYSGERFDFLIKKYCAQKKLKNIAEIFSVLTASISPSFFREEEIELKKIVRFVEKAGIKKSRGLKNTLPAIGKKRFYKLLVEHQLKYSWIKGSYAGNVEYSLYQVIKKLERILSGKIVIEADFFRQNRIAKQAMIKKYGFTPEILALVKSADKVTAYQEQRKKYTLMFVGLLGKMKKEISHRFKIKTDLIGYARIDELAKLIKGKNYLQKLSQRRESSLFIYKNGEAICVATGKSAKNFLRAVSKIVYKKLDKFDGISASIGKARGIVRIIRSIKDLGKMKQGNILVAGMTRPEHISAMKKAAAIVTDDGGLTCHAAIMSRELGIPAIVGTRIATKVLHDGDLVEVDANKGEVKILKN